MRLKLKLLIASVILCASSGNSADAQSFHYNSIVEKNEKFELLEFGYNLERLKVSSFSLNNDAMKRRSRLPSWSQSNLYGHAKTRVDFAYYSHVERILRAQTPVFEILALCKFPHWASKAEGIFREHNLLNVGRLVNETEEAARYKRLLNDKEYSDDVKSQLTRWWLSNVNAKKVPRYSLFVNNDGTVHEIVLHNHPEINLALEIACAEAITKMQFKPLPSDVRDGSNKPLRLDVSMNYGLIPHTSDMILHFLGKPTSLDNPEPVILPLRDKVWTWWKHEGFNGTSPAVSFQVGKDGSVSRAKIVKTSGDKHFDRACLAAINRLRADSVPPWLQECDSISVALNVGERKFLNRGDNWTGLYHPAPRLRNPYELRPYDPKLGGI